MTGSLAIFVHAMPRHFSLKIAALAIMATATFLFHADDSAALLAQSNNRPNVLMMLVDAWNRI